MRLFDRFHTSGRPAFGHTCSLCRRNAAREAAFTVVACVVIVLLLGLAHRLDEPAQLPAQEATLISQRAYEAGRAQGREDMSATVGDAYLQGRRDARAEQLRVAGSSAAGAR